MSSGAIVQEPVTTIDGKEAVGRRLFPHNLRVDNATAAFETPWLVVRPLAAEDLESALAAYVSNPQYVALTEGSAGEPGLFDLGMLQRDFAVARMTPGRHFLGLVAKTTDELIGVLDWLEQNPRTGTRGSASFSCTLGTNGKGSRER